MVLMYHEDLQPNYDAATSYDYCDNDEIQALFHPETIMALQSLELQQDWR